MNVRSYRVVAWLCLAEGCVGIGAIVASLGWGGFTNELLLQILVAHFWAGGALLARSRRARELAIALGWLDVCLGLIPLIGLGLQLAVSYESDEGFVDLLLPLAGSLTLLGIGAFKIRVLSHPQTGKAMLRDRR